MRTALSPIRETLRAHAHNAIDAIIDAPLESPAESLKLAHLLTTILAAARMPVPYEFGDADLEAHDTLPTIPCPPPAECEVAS